MNLADHIDAIERAGHPMAEAAAGAELPTKFPRRLRLRWQ